MLRRIAIVGLAAAGFASLGTPAYAASDPGLVKLSYTVDPDSGYVGLGTAVGSQPLFGARVDTATDENTAEACVGFSYQVPQCAEVPLSFS